MVSTVARADSADDFSHKIAKILDSRLAVVERRLAEISAEMKMLPVLTDMDALGSHGFHSNFTLGSEENWFAISWPEPQPIDGIALIPTRLTTQSGDFLDLVNGDAQPIELFRAQRLQVGGNFILIGPIMNALGTMPRNRFQASPWKLAVSYQDWLTITVTQ